MLIILFTVRFLDKEVRVLLYIYGSALLTFEDHALKVQYVTVKPSLLIIGDLCQRQGHWYAGTETFLETDAIATCCTRNKIVFFFTRTSCAGENQTT